MGNKIFLIEFVSNLNANFPVKKLISHVLLLACTFLKEKKTSLLDMWHFSIFLASDLFLNQIEIHKRQ